MKIAGSPASVFASASGGGKMLADRYPMPRHLFIVSRKHPSLHAYLSQHFVDAPEVEVVLDRRRAERRRLERGPDGAERRQGERRTHPGLDRTLEHDSHVFLSLP